MFNILRPGFLNTIRGGEKKDSPSFHVENTGRLEVFLCICVHAWWIY